MSSLLLTLALSRVRVLVGAETGTGGTQRGHNSSRSWPRTGAFDLTKAKMRSSAASHSSPAANTAWIEPALRTTPKS